MNTSMSLAAVVNIADARNEIARQTAITHVVAFSHIYNERFPDDQRLKLLLKALNVNQKTSDSAKSMIQSILDDVQKAIETASLMEVNNYRAARCVADAAKFCTDDIVDIDKIFNEFDNAMNLLRNNCKGIH